MRKYFNKFTIVTLIIFILQSLNVHWCITNPNISNIAMYIALFVDGSIFGVLFTILIINKV